MTNLSSLTKAQLIAKLEKSERTAAAQAKRIDALLAERNKLATELTELRAEVLEPAAPETNSPAPWGAEEQPFTDFVAKRRAKMALAKAAAAAKYGNSRLRPGNSW